MIPTDAGIDAETEPDTETGAVLRYHAQSSHGADRYAPGPSQVDWSTQPDAFRRFDGAPRLTLPDVAEPVVSYTDLFVPEAVPPAPATLESLSILLRFSLGISGWKSTGDAPWPLRCNPSSGNLHPVEGYVLACGIRGLPDGLHHYDARAHALEMRYKIEPGEASLRIGLSTVPAREIWKYGLRAFRYCQQDTGHAEAAVAFAAATLGWQVVRENLPLAQLAALLGTDREADYRDTEPEEAESLLQIMPGPLPAPRPEARWYGNPSRCAADTIRDRDVEEVLTATRGSVPNPTNRVSLPTIGLPTIRLPTFQRAPSPSTATEIIRNRRSARQFTSRRPPAADTLCTVLRAALPQTGPLSGILAGKGFEIVVAVHRVNGLEPGLYALSDALPPDFDWQPVATGVPDLPLYRLTRGDVRVRFRQIACQQGIAAEGAATLVFLADFDAALAGGTAGYRQLHRDAGAIAQALYLEATHAGLGASGIGCFLDEPLREMLLRPETTLRPVYLFGLGVARPDPYLLPPERWPVGT